MLWIQLIWLVLVSIHSLLYLAEEMELTTAMSPHGSPHVAAPERAASSLLTEQEINAHLQVPATVSISHASTLWGEFGEFAAAASLFQT